MNSTTEVTEQEFGLEAAINNIVDKNGAETLVRTEGSYLAIGGNKVVDPIVTISILKEQIWKERTEEVRSQGSGFGKCRYFMCRVPSGVKAFKAAVNLDEYAKIVFENGLPFDITLNPKPEFGGDARHQTELTSKYVPAQPTNELWIIVGNFDNPHQDFTLESGVVYTWHPGRIYPRTDTVIKLS